MTDSNPVEDRPDVAVVGGGLAGLTAAAIAARSGARVTLYEARAEIGGRARTEQVDGFGFNQGAHALYRAGAGMPILRELGVNLQGRMPRQRGGRWVHEGQITPLTKLGAIGGMRGLATARRMASKAAIEKAGDMSMAAWLDEHVAPEVRPFAEMLLRTTGYAIDFDHQHAGETLAQVRRGARGVLYLHGGWSTLVSGLQSAAIEAGVVVDRQRVTSVRSVPGAVELALGSGTTIEAGSVVLAAGGATQADHLLSGASPQVARWADQARPVRAAALDLALRRLPAGRRLVAYGLGEPTYLVDHAPSADLAPKGSALVHCLWYEPDLAPEVDHRARLEASLDLLQPGWRNEVVEARFSRRLVVAHDRPQPGMTQTDRPRPELDDVPNVFVAGDWITGEGLLADAALASGRAAGVAAAVVRSRSRAQISAA